MPANPIDKSAIKLRRLQDMNLKGKRVLVVEDDVCSGATLARLLTEIAPHEPSELGR